MIDLTENIVAANNILTAVENTFNSEGIELPARRYVTLGGQGTVAYDCAQLTVSWERNYSGLPGMENPTISSCKGIHTGVFIVELVRDIPVSQNASIPPEPSLIQEAAEGLMRDAAVLYGAGSIAIEGNEILDKGTINIVAGSPGGAVQSIIMTIEMGI